MEFIECVKNRRSIRKFKETPVDRATIEKIISIATCAPSWKNSQTTRYVVIENKELQKEIGENYVLGFEHNGNIIKNTPAIVLITTVTSRSGFERDGSYSTAKGTHWESFDAGIATQTFCLTATDQGLGTVILGIYDEEKIIKVTNIPEGQKISTIIAIGYPDEEPNMPKRKDADDLLSYR